MDSQYKNQRRVYHLLIGLLFVVLSGCSIIPQIGHRASKHIEQPIIAPVQPHRVVQVCLDTPPLYPARYFHQAAQAIADRIDASVTVNQIGMDLYVSLITHDSFQNDVLSFSVPAFPADPPPPVKAVPGDNPYDNAKAESEYQTASAAWQSDLLTQHTNLAALRAQVKVETNKLRSLTPPFDNIASDVYGCLDDASEHFKHTTGEKYLLIASDLINNTLLQRPPALSLLGVSVRVIWRTCTIAATCQASDSYWQHMFLRYGAKDVAFYDPAQSEVEKPTF